MTDFPCEHVIFKPVHPAKIADSELVHHEFARHRVESIRQTVFQRDNMPYWEKSGKTPPFAQWYREATKYRDPRDGRPYVEWKTNAEFRDDRIFFKTLDTGRILPMHLANFRVHFFTTKWYWEQFDQNRKREGTLFTELASLVSNERAVSRWMLTVHVTVAIHSCVQKFPRLWRRGCSYHYGQLVLRRSICCIGLLGGTQQRRMV